MSSLRCLGRHISTRLGTRRGTRGHCTTSRPFRFTRLTTAPKWSTRNLHRTPSLQLKVCSCSSASALFSFSQRLVPVYISCKAKCPSRRFAFAHSLVQVRSPCRRQSGYQSRLHACSSRHMDRRYSTGGRKHMSARSAHDHARSSLVSRPLASIFARASRSFSIILAGFTLRRSFIPSPWLQSRPILRGSKPVSRFWIVCGLTTQYLLSRCVRVSGKCVA